MTNEAINAIIVGTNSIPVYLVANPDEFARHSFLFINGFGYGCIIGGIIFTVGMVAKAMRPNRYGQD